MAKPQTSFNKRENEKKQLKKRQDKEARREERQANAKKGQGDDAMLAYVDEFGNITSTPPDPTKKQEIDAASIEVSVRKLEERDPEDPTRTGTVTFFNDAKGFGFIRDAQTRESIFVHANSLNGLTLRESDQVTFEVEAGQKGPVAVRVKPAGQSA